MLKNEDIVAPQPGTPYYRMERPKIFKWRVGAATSPGSLKCHITLSVARLQPRDTEVRHVVPL